MQNRSIGYGQKNVKAVLEFKNNARSFTCVVTESSVCEIDSDNSVDLRFLSKPLDNSKKPCLYIVALDWCNDTFDSGR